MVWLEYIHLSKLQYLYKKPSNLYFTHSENLPLDRSQATGYQSQKLSISVPT